MAKTFPGYPKKGITFLRQLAKNNNRDWFQENKKTYTEFVREPTIGLVEAVNAKLERFAVRTRPEGRRHRREVVVTEGRAVALFVEDGSGQGGPPVEIDGFGVLFVAADHHGFRP